MLFWNKNFRACAGGAAFCVGLAAHASTPAPEFDVAYRAWDTVTDIARYNRNPSISGVCGRTFRPFVIAGLKMQAKREQDVAAVACYDAARSVCADAKLQRTTDIAKKCAEFK